MNQDRTFSVSTSPSTAVVPMPGRLAVSYTNWDLRLTVDTTLDQAPADTVLTATGTITTVRFLDTTTAGRVNIVLTDDNGDSAHVSLNPDMVRMLQPVLVKGTRLTIRGTAIAAHGTVPAGIDGRGAQVVNV
jgi:hypothetical protein